MRVAVTEIRWKRVWMEFVLCVKAQEADAAVRFGVLVDEAGRLGAKLASAGEPGRQVLRLNVTNAGDARCIREGRYSLLVSLSGERQLCPVYWECPEGERIFRYGKQGGEFAVSWSRGTEGDGLVEVSQRAPEPGRGLRALYTRGMHRFLQGWYAVVHRLTPGKRRTVLLLTEQNSRLDENLEVLRERMAGRGLEKSFPVETSCRISVTREHLGVVSWVRTVGKLARAGVLFLDDHAPLLDWLVLAPDVKTVQLWHAGVGFKSSGYSRWETEGGLAPFSCHRQYTYGVCASEGDRDLFAEIWGINREQVIPAGLPRLDRFLDGDRGREKRETFYKKFPSCRGKRVILFAPTYRGHSRLDARYPFELVDFESWHEACGEDTVVLFRMHPWVREAVPIPEHCRNRLIDVSGEGRINDLYFAADLLITDYSSDIFEFSLLKKPMLFYAPDREEYRRMRGIHGDYRELAPGKVTETFPELLKAIREEDFEAWRAEAYRERHFDHIDTKNADRVIDWFLLGQMPREYAADGERSRRLADRIGRPLPGDLLPRGERKV